MLVISKIKVQSESDIDVDDVHIEPGRLVVIVLHPLAHADEAGLLIRGLPRSANIHLHCQSSRLCALGQSWGGTENAYLKTGLKESESCQHYGCDL